MGAGKSFWGPRLAGRGHVPFIDLDAYIEAGEGTPIAGLFERVGEPGFRELEQQYLHQMAALPLAVVATGGGTPCFFDNMAWMNEHGLTIYLDTPVPVLAARLRADQSTRPLLRQVSGRDLETHIGALVQQREPFYRQAAVIADFSDREEELFERLCHALASGG